MQSGQRYSRWAIAGVSGVAAASLIAGCGSSNADSAKAGTVPSGSPSKSQPSSGSPSSNAPFALLAAAAGQTEAAENARLHIDVKVNAGGKDVTFGGDGIIDFAGKKFQLSLKLPAQAGFSGTIEERLIGKDLYLMLPSELRIATGGKAWAKVDTSKVSGGASNLDAYQQDPTQFLSTLRSVSSSVTKVGTTQVRGVKTTHYRAQVDLTKAAARGGSGAAALEQYRKLLGSTTLPEDVYLDDKGLARRFSVSIAAPNSGQPTAGAASIGAVSTTVDLYDFGSTDTSRVVAPPAAEVGTLPSSGLSG